MTMKVKENLFRCFHVITLLFISPLAVERVGAMRENRAHVQSSLGGYSFSDDIQFSASARSSLECALKCVDTAKCASFTFSKSTLICQGHEETPESSDNKVVSTGARTWSLAETQTTSGCPSGDLNAANWLDAACSSDGDCTAENSECFNSLCKCSPGYYYSECANTCVGGCDQLGTNFTLYSGWAIVGHHLVMHSFKTAEECRALCLAETWCRTIEVWDAGTCQLFDVTPGDVGSDFSTYSADTYQRTCA